MGCHRLGISQDDAEPKLKMKLTREELDKIKVAFPLRFDGCMVDKLILHAEDTVDADSTAPKEIILNPTDEQIKQMMRKMAERAEEYQRQQLRLQLSATFLQQLLHGKTWGDESRVAQSVRLTDELLAELERTK